MITHLIVLCDVGKVAPQPVAKHPICAPTKYSESRMALVVPKDTHLSPQHCRQLTAGRSTDGPVQGMERTVW